MANIIATSGDNQILIDDGDRLYLATNVQVIVDENVAAITGSDSSANGHEVTIDGTLVAMGANAIILGDDVTGVGANTLVIGESGVVRSLNYQGNSAIYMIGSSSFLQNWGEVTGTWGSFLQGFDNGKVENHGVMAGSSQEGLYLTSSVNVQVVNTGVISGGDSISFITSDGTVQNSGQIIGSGESGYGIDAVLSTDGIKILNTGLITSIGLAAIQLGVFDDIVRNSGQIDGDVLLGDGADKFRGFEGTTTGDVFGEGGNDLLIGGANSDRLDGGDGDDVLRGRDGEDTLLGGGGVDLLRGGKSDDSLDGSGGNDELYGGSGNDELIGGAGFDALHGGNDDDMLYGGGGRDELNGGRGNDTLSGGTKTDVLIGGEGDDILRGGLGSDVFVFAPNCGSDQIVDFQNGSDKIDLSAFGLRPAHFATIVQPALSNAGGGDTLLDLADFGGNGILIVGGLAFADTDATDFIL